MRQGTRGVRGTFVQIESRMSQTGANADVWLPARPGTDGALALGLAHVIMRDGLARASVAGAAGAAIEGWAAGLPQFAPPEVERLSGVPAARIEELARSFAQSPARWPSSAALPSRRPTGSRKRSPSTRSTRLVGSVGVPGGIQFTPALPGRASASRRLATRARGETSQPAVGTVAALATHILATEASPIDVADRRRREPRLSVAQVVARAGSARACPVHRKLRELPRRHERPRGSRSCPITRFSSRGWTSFPSRERQSRPPASRRR